MLAAAVSSPEDTAFAQPKQNPELNGLYDRLRFKASDSAAHRSTVDSYDQYWNKDRSDATIFENAQSATSGRRENAKTLTNHYYDLVTDFYEYGWGSSFHFSRMWKNLTFAQCTARHEDYLALKLGLAAGQKCLDVGCGVGGPLREIASFSGAHVTGLNNNQYQVERCNYLNQQAGLSDITHAVKGDFQDMEFPSDSFDAAYAIEATCHAARLEMVYGEIFRVLKPGSTFCCYEWLTTAAYDETNPEMKRVIRNLEEGNSISKLYSIEQCLEALRTVGFEVVESEDLASSESPLSAAQDPWYSPLQGTFSLSFDQLYRWRMNPLGRFMTDKLVLALETTRLAPPGSRKVSSLLNMAAEALVKGGSMKIFTPMFFFRARKPLN